MTTRTGHCMCGAVRFTAQNVPSGFGACYCESCRRWSGDRFAGVHVASDDLDVTGADHVTTLQSSAWANRSFCKTCGSSLWYRLTDGPEAGSCSISVGLLDDASGLVLEREFFVDRKDCIHDLPADRIQMTTADITAKYGALNDGNAQ
ncbi:GFA family protein [Shimia thalassica]|uniref:GFA family protein n=1 Tax=Shimia thalassica TaxID=1715693 RepID=UPI002733867E|nr:GFA family protein [Shimia thalassica]MDP2580163.1 GFA family protein [Shimia thalassica]